MNSSSPSTADNDRQVALWLMTVATLVVAMMALGALTRLTESGLSMVEWRPITGWAPPLSEAAWQEEFAKYRQSPEYQKINRGMSLEQFKGIFWLEYLHRLLGRVIGLAFALPFVWFLWRGKIRKQLSPHLLAMFALGGLQGVVGWLMVQSGLVDRPSVSHYRLTLHLGLAAAIYAYIVWIALGLLQARPRQPPFACAGARAFVIYSFLVLLSGAMVAGLDGGLTHNSFPLMSGRLIPADAYLIEPAWLNHFENPATVQFQHRWLAMALVGFAFVLWWRARRLPAQAAAIKTAAAGLLGVALLQAALGIATLLLSVPTSLATLHQLGAIAVFSFGLVLLHRHFRP